MRYRDFGKTGLKISELVFGCGAIGGLMIQPDEDKKRRAVARALEAGINWFDTAPLYGHGVSETALGLMLSERPETPYVSTKFSLDTENLSNIRSQITTSVERSLTRLKRKNVTLLQLHDRLGSNIGLRMVTPDVLLRAGGVCDVLDDLKRQGLIGHYGITALGETQSILRVIESGRIESAQVYYNLLNPSAALAQDAPWPAQWPLFRFAGLLAACAKHGVAPLAIRIFSAGVIATDARHGREAPLTAGDSVDSETAKARAVFVALGGTNGTRAQTALRFVLSETRFAAAIFGLAELEHLEEALEAEAMGPLPADSIQALPRIYEAGVT